MYTCKSSGFNSETWQPFDIERMVLDMAKHRLEDREKLSNREKEVIRAAVSFAEDHRRPFKNNSYSETGFGTKMDGPVPGSAKIYKKDAIAPKMTIHESYCTWNYIKSMIRNLGINDGKLVVNWTSDGIMVEMTVPIEGRAIQSGPALVNVFENRDKIVDEMVIDNLDVPRENPLVLPDKVVNRLNSLC